ncbi:uncharacterized protein LOC118504439 [Anopheles stephensi]|uniref:Uncharacterized protein n=1 Tax=Anopheles stephensi TaxID=30069 RepID=A0A182XW88_ANOST|nr:uncharacterized protein LOC118504439 [Anopheles stephensi]
MPPRCTRETMTVGSVQHPNVLPQSAAASAARVTAAYDYTGTGSGGGGISGSGSLTHGGGSSLRSSGIGSGRISPNSPSTNSSAFGMMRTPARRCLFDRPDPTDTRRIYEDHEKAERQRVIKQYGFDPYTERGLTSSKSSASAGGLHHRHHHQ